MYFEAKTFLHGLFVVEDKLSMAHGLETRVPFMDNDLVDFALQCPVSLKLNRLSDVIRINENEAGNKSNKYFQKTNDGKQILRDAMSRYLPSEVSEAEKQGFSSPDASWFKGDSIDYVRKTLLEGDAMLYTFFDRGVVSKILEQHIKGQKNYRLFIWSLLNLENWLVQMPNLEFN
jgi:asparagine synthase (glutamine-hydrolysing)